MDSTSNLSIDQEPVGQAAQLALPANKLPLRNIEAIRTRLRDEDFAFYPNGWYYAADSTTLKRGVAKVTVFNKELVLYRTESGAYKAMDSRCPHMNAPLYMGKVAGEQLQCPMHGWRFSDGQCKHQASNQSTVKHYPVALAGQHIFIAPNADKIPAFPQYDEAPMESFVFGKALQEDATTPWYLAIANGFDLVHFPHIHGRELEDSSGLLQGLPHRIEINHKLLNRGSLITDKLLRRLFGARVELFYRVFNGNTILSKTRIAGKDSFIWIDIQRINSERSRVTMIPVILGDNQSRLHRILARVSLAIRSVFISKFFRAEDPYISGMKLNPDTLVENDRPIGEFLVWLADRRNTEK